MKNQVFQVTEKEVLDFSFLTEKQIIQYPVYEQHLTKVTQFLVVYEYDKLGSKFNMENWIKLMCIKLKKKFNADSVVYLGSKTPEVSLKEST